MPESLKQRLDVIETALDDGTYRAGPWQTLVRDLDQSPRSDRAALAADVSRVSRKLHRRNNFAELAFLPALSGEVLLFLLSLYALSETGLIANILGVALLGATLQPLMKVMAGLLLGVRYDYAYLWYFEPRFKMRFGSYLCLGGPSRVLFHLAGSVGTPIALWVGYVVLTPHLPWLGWLSLLGAAGERFFHDLG